MARPKKTDSPDLSGRVRLTLGAIERLSCPPNKSQVFMRCDQVPSLRVRCTPAGAKSFVFENKLNRQTIRITIGDVRDWDIDLAQAHARKLAILVDEGQDPREVARKQEAEKAARRVAEEAARLADLQAQEPAALAFAAYIEAKRAKWGARNLLDAQKLTQAGGQERPKRGQRPDEPTVIQPGPLWALLQHPLPALDRERVRAWLEQEAARRPARARLALAHLSGFLTWCSRHPDYKPRVKPDAVAGLKREVLERAPAKDDALQREQLPAWFDAARQQNPVIAAYLQSLLLLGCRPGELLGLRWADVDFQWRSLTIRDKVEGERTIPLPPFVAGLLAALPRRGAWVFMSGRVHDGGVVDSPIAPPNHAAVKVCKAAGIDAVTLHGLRRSFASLTEWIECPQGVVAQIMGHKPSATAERHYKRRPLDLLRMWHDKIEGWVLEQAGIEQPAAAAAPLRAIK